MRESVGDVIGVGVVGFGWMGQVHARALLEEGRIGTVTHARFRLLTDYAADPGSVLSWRFRQASAGTGVLGDLVSHGVDLARHLLGEIDSVVADRAVFIPERPAADGAVGPVENEDWVGCLVRFASGTARRR